MYAVDLHVHTCLSPCGELEMHPSALVATARERGLAAVAVCDHNTAGNAAATMRAGARVGLTVLAGMEITSEEEVHVVALLPDAVAAGHLQARVGEVLAGRNVPVVFGDQVLVDEHGVVVGFEDRWLIGATTWSLEQVVATVHEEGGLAIAAHVDRERFGLLGQLGLVPGGLPLDALEVSPRLPFDEARARFGGHGLPVVTASDAHRLADLGRAVTWVRLERPAFDELRQALRGENGRVVLGGGRPMEDLSLHILDVAQNAVEAGATSVTITVDERVDENRLLVEISDDGRGMDAETVARALDPFFTTRTTRRVGLGLSLLAAAARASGGDVEVESAPGQGTRVRATFGHAHLDRPPLGDLETTVLVLAAGAPGLRLVFRHLVDGRRFELDTDHLRAVLDGAALSSPAGLAALRRALRAGEAALRAPAGAEKGDA